MGVSPSFPGVPEAPRAASITAVSSIQPWNDFETPSPFETQPVIGSEPISIASRS